MENQQQPSSNLCRANCGFYGAPQFEDFCSKCFKDFIKRKQQTTDPATQRHSPINIGSSSACTTSDASTQAPPIAADLPLTTVAIGDGSVICGVDTAAIGAIEKQINMMDTTIEAATAANNENPLKQTIESKTEATDTGTTPTSFQGAEVAAVSAICAAGSDSATAPLAEEKPKKPPNRCHMCNKKVGLTGIPCRCGGIYCSEHRYSQAHECTFDYKTVEREGLRKSNPVVVSEKIERI